MKPPYEPPSAAAYRHDVDLRPGAIVLAGTQDASQRPSGERRGQWSLGPLVKRFGGEEPSVGITQISLR